MVDEESGWAPVSHSPEETQALGVQIGELAQPGDIYLLVGKLGAGKTCLTQGIAWGLGIKEYAASPSFVLLRELHGRLPLYHVDLYRLDRTEEVADLGLDDYFYGQGVCVVEWADRGLPVLPPAHLLVEIKYLDENSRHIRLKPNGKRYLDLVAQLREKVAHANSH
ncbi:MAG: tRNA (adenosine(37)-N6)-threonylcarbamoyltransferase complex ATPase subunit type 1 TsaE [Chloroflexi bacterium]|nr:tRNA (adenosine(37)-N6)-threonylcarbamoyltransferase complex ATPase subunit type 1 TsaE [Chloroflexota bacterium]